LYTPKNRCQQLEPDVSGLWIHTHQAVSRKLVNTSYPTGENSAFPKFNAFIRKHLTEWVEGSAVSEAIASLNIESLTVKELNERIRPKEPIKTGGWWVRGVLWKTGERAGNWYGQGKPDKPHQPEGSKPRKYLTGSGMEPDAIFLAMPDKDYWSKVHADKSIPRHWTEGTKKAGAGLSIGLATIAATGVWNWGKDGKLAHFVKEWAEPETVHYIDFDSDYAANPSCRAAILKFGRLLVECGCEVHITVWDTQFKGMDDFIKANGGEAFKEAVTSALTLDKWEKQLKKGDRKIDDSTSNNSSTSHPRTREEVVCQKYDSSENDYIPDTAPTALQNFVQKAEAALYSDGHWKSIGGQLYHYVGSHYELRSESEEKRRIGDWLNTYAEKVKGVWVNNRAKSSNVAEVLNWVVNRNAVDPNKINPDGLNCSNGVVRINPDGSHLLVPHDPNQVYTYVGSKYDPDVDSADCDRLLECLEPAQREIFLRTAAAALHLKLVRSKLTGKGVKGLLCYGEGSNGKDTLRAVLATVFGRGMTGKSLSDFKAYDGGRKFALATIEGGVCNWASENASNVSLDALQSLKQFITGDPIDIERKGKDSYEYKPTAIFLANCNKLPSITGGTAAIDDRYGILSFKKTYKRGAVASQGELEADPRFKDDPDFILERIAPAMLNKMLERMPLLLAEGIDYKATREAMREAQEESRHLWQFAREVGLEFNPEGKVYIGDLYKILEDWYQENGWLTFDSSGTKSKKFWEAESPYDSPVKKSQDLYLRLRELFPKIERRVDTQERYGHKFIFGLKLVNSSQASQGSCTEPVSSQGSSQGSKQVTCDGTCDETLVQKQPCYPCDESSLFTEFLQWFSKQPQSEREKMVKRLTQPQPEPEQLDRPTQPKTVEAKKGLRVRYIGTKYAEQLAGLELVVDDIDQSRQITCLKPDGRFTTRLDPKDLEVAD
jgi:putative DNA primase/helicase